MSLDTVLKIGKTFRMNAKDKMKHFRYVASPKVDKDGNYPICITIPINEDFSFDWDRVCKIPQNKIDNLYYLRYKTSDNDLSAAKYVFGDIYYQIDRSFDNKGNIKTGKKITESGNYILLKSNAFANAKKTRESFIKEILGKKPIISQKDIIQCIEENKIDDSKEKEVKNFIQKNDLLRFWYSFFVNKDKIEQYLLLAPIYETLRTSNDSKDDYCRYLFENQYDKIKKAIANKKSFDELTNEEKDKIFQYTNHSVYIHFEFKDKKNWYEIESCFDVIIKTLNEELTNKQQGDLLVPTSFIYPTLCSGNAKNDIQFPDFKFDNSHKSYAFKGDEVFQDFLYTSAILDDRKGLNKQKMWLRGTSISIYIFPAAFSKEEISAKNYESFFFDNKGQQSLFDFDFLNDEQQELFTRFDFVFSDTGGNTNKNLIEISGIERNKLLTLRETLHKIENDISTQKQNDLKWSDKPNMQIENSFSNLFGKTEVDKNKVIFKNEIKKGKPYPPYQSHMIKVMPLIYTENYHNDESLLENLIQKVEFSIRNGSEKEYDYSNYFMLKYDLMLLLKIQNNINDKYMEITESKSYQLGGKLGKLSKPLKKAIVSFEKSYVGLLTRRIATKDDCISFTNDICEKLVMHEKVWSSFASEVCSELALLPIAEYDKEKLAFGYFEGYFKYEPNDTRKSFVGRIEKILSDYKGNESFKLELEQLSELVEEFNKQ